MKKFTIILVGVLLIVGCQSDFLERYPITLPSEANFWNDDSDLEIYCNQFYSVFPIHQVNSENLGVFGIDNNSDNMVPSDFDQRLAGTRVIPTSGGGWDWDNVRTANYFLENFHKVEVTDANRANVRHYHGEARFFRAFIYYNLLRNFGDLPWIGKTLSPNFGDLQIEREKRNVIADSIIADLDLAIELLKPKEQADLFRVNREIALAFKSRVCLYEGTWEKYHHGTVFGVQGSNGEKYLKLAVEASETLMEEGKFSLHFVGGHDNAYRSLFNKVDLSNNPEILLWKKYDVTLNVTNQVQKVLAFGGGATGLSKSLIDDYLMVDGRPTANHTDYLGDFSLRNVVGNRDPRLAQTLTVQGYPLQVQNGQAVLSFERPSLEVANEFRSTTGYHLYKGLDPEQIIYAPNMALSTAAIVFRYAEVLLNYAEAKAELGELTQANLDASVNRLRDRVGMAHLKLSEIEYDPHWIFPSLSPIINEVRRERRVELVADGLRLDDLMRWRAHTVFKDSRPKGMRYIGSELEGTYIDQSTGDDLLLVGANIFVDEHGYIDPYKRVAALQEGYQFDPNRDYLSPIPINELQLNGLLLQNPGW